MALQDTLGSSEINSKMANKIPKAFDVVTLVDVIEDYFGDDCAGNDIVPYHTQINSYNNGTCIFNLLHLLQHKAMHIWNQVRGSWFEQRVPF